MGFIAGVRGRKEARSFLKKRTKKLLSIERDAGSEVVECPSAFHPTKSAAMDKVFLLLFVHKKKNLAFSWIA